MKIKKLVLMRHGESEWNQQNKFTGWYDINLSKNGKKEAKLAGNLLKKYHFNFDYAYTSVLKRAIKTLNIILDELNLLWIPCKKSWNLNERHYGALQGLNKLEIEKKYGFKQVSLWRRSYSTIPPEININQEFDYSGYDDRYIKINKKDLPKSESLENTFNRVVPFWKNHIFPKLQKQKKILIVAHGNSLRALIKYLSAIDDHQIVKINIPTGTPLIYEFNANFNVKKYYYLNNIDQ